jgi:hypothetical protein
MRLARMWNSRLPGVETAWRAPARISPEGMQLCRPRRAKKTIPRVGAKPHDARKSSLQVAKFHSAHQCGEVSAERAQGGAIFRAQIERCDQEDRGASKRRGYCLREDRQSTCRFGCVRRTGLDRVLSLRVSGFLSPKCYARLLCNSWPCHLTIDCQTCAPSGKSLRCLITAVVSRIVFRADVFKSKRPNRRHLRDVLTGFRPVEMGRVTGQNDDGTGRIGL